MAKNVYDNKNTFSINPSDEVKKSMEKLEFDVNQVWTVDVVVSSGEGKVKEKETKTTVYKRNILSTYQLKMKASRRNISLVKNKYRWHCFDWCRILQRCVQQIHRISIHYPSIQRYDQG